MTKPNMIADAIRHMPHSPELVAALIAERYRKDPRLRRQMDDDPKQALEQVLKRPIASNIQVVAHKNTDDTWHLPLPGTELPDLSDEQLEQVSAGEVVYLGVALGAVAAVGLVGLAVGIAIPLADQ